MGQSTGIFTPFFSLNLTRDVSRSTEGDGMPVHPLILGQKVAAGSATSGTIHKVVTLADVESLAGKGSHLYQVMKSYFAKRSFTDVSIGVLEDAGGSAAATRTLTVTTPSTVGGGTLAFAVSGERLSVPVDTTDTPTTIAAKIVAEYNSESYRYLTAANVAGVVTFTTKNKGVAMGGIYLVLNPVEGVDRTPAGVAVAFGTESAGTGVPSLSSIFTAMGETHYYAIYSPYADSVSIGAAEVKVDNLGSPDVARDCMYIAFAGNDTVNNLKSLASATINKYVSVVDTYNFQCGVATIVGSVAREVSSSVKSDVNKPLHNLVLPSLVGPVSGTQRIWDDRNELAKYGIATLNPEKLTLEAPVTTYIATSEERRWENIFNLADLRISFVNRILTRYGRAKIRRGDERIAPNQQVITPSSAKSEASAWYAENIYKGRVEDQEYFDSEAYVVLADVDTLDFYLPVSLVGQFVVGTGTLSYILSGGN